MNNKCESCNRPPAEDENACLYRMADGRHFTQYSATCGSYNELRAVNGLATSYETRKYLMENAEKLMSENMQYALNKNACPCFPTDAQGTLVPEKDMIKCNANYCQFYGKDENGVGLGRASM